MTPGKTGAKLCGGMAAPALQERLFGPMEEHGMHYDKDGKAIDWHQWSVLLRDAEYKRVARSTAGVYDVSTVWVGLELHPSDPPAIFETMVFGDGPHDGWQNRYATLADAEVGHQRAVAALVDGLAP